MNCSHVILLEDDALADHNWTALLREAVHLLNQRVLHSTYEAKEATDKRKSWVLMKLFVARETYDGRLESSRVTDYDGRMNAVALLLNPYHLLGLKEAIETNIR